jgi:tRNA (guanine37-N1)-methyltransferase
VIFHILTLFPEIFDGYRKASILARALDQEQVILDLIDIRDYARDKHRTCDDATYGGGAGMVLKPEPLAAALDSIAGEKTGDSAAAEDEVAIICGRYEGIDQRIIDMFVTDEISVGDYILSGGEVAAMVVLDTVVRLVKGVIKERSLVEESFRRGLLEYPQYTRPATFRGRKVPDVLVSGHHEEIERWRLKKSIEKTLRFRPELIEKQRGEEDGQSKSD